MTKRAHLRSRPDARNNRRTDSQPCQLFCKSGLPATRCIAGVFICQPCYTKTKAIEADADERGPESIRTIIPRVLAAIERGGAA